MAFAHALDCVNERTLQPGEALKIDQGFKVAYTAGIVFDIEFIKGNRNFMFGGKGLFFATLRGQSKVLIQA